VVGPTIPEKHGVSSGLRQFPALIAMQKWLSACNTPCAGMVRVGLFINLRPLPRGILGHCSRS
jgi:hypothetical protein